MKPQGFNPGCPEPPTNFILGVSSFILIHMQPARRILIIKPSSLGDVATAMPILTDIRRAWPDAQIDWLIHPSLADLLRGHEAIHELIPFDRKQLGPWWYKPAATKLLTQLIRRLREAHYDDVIDAQGLFRSAFLTRITGAKVRIGFANAREGAPLVYTHKVTLPKKPQVAVVRMRQLLQPLGIPFDGPAEARMPVNPEAAARVAALLGPAPRIMLIPGARWDTKRWSGDGYIEIGRRLVAAGMPIAILGSPDEKTLCDAIAGLILPSREDPRLVNLAGRTKMADMIAALASAKLIIGNDSGPLHVAVALNRPTVSIYGPTNPEFVGPYGQLDRVVRFNVDCFPCRNKTCSHHSCMKGVEVEAVWKKVMTALRARS